MEQTFNDHCRNEMCACLENCPLRPGAKVASASKSQLEQSKGFCKSRFSVDSHGVGELVIQERFSSALDPILSQVEGQQESLAGLFVGLNSAGGSEWTLGRLLRIFFKLKFKRMIPVFTCAAVQACSAAFIALCLGSRVFCDCSTELGNFGFLAIACDAGNGPVSIVSAGSPAKISPEMILPPPLDFLPGSREEQQEYMNVSYEVFRGLLHFARPAAKFDDFLDGRCFGELEALRAGIIDQIAEGPYVYRLLLNEVEKNS